MRILEKYGIATILYLLGKNNSMKISDIQKVLKQNTRYLYKALEIMSENGLIKVSKETTFPFTKTVKLTDKGRRVADLLSEIERVLEE